MRAFLQLCSPKCNLPLAITKLTEHNNYIAAQHTKDKDMTTKNTPGPWEWIGDNLEAGSDDVLRVGDDGKEYGMHSAVLFESEDPEQAAANRALIAAAPDLLALLVESQDNIGGDWRDRRDKAIAKATGAA